MTNWFSMAKDRLDHLSARPWTDLRTLSNSTAARATVLIPLVGYLIVFNENIAQYLALASELGGTGSAAQVSSRLLSIYLGLTFVAVGAVIYGRYCPPEVKRFQTASSYIQSDKESLLGPPIEAIERQLVQSEWALQFDAMRLRLDGKADRGVLKDADWNNFHNGVLHLYFEYQNHSHRFSRQLVTSAYVVGFVFLGIPSLLVFVRVVGLLTSQILGWR